MALPIFAYIISLVMISNPAAMAAVQSESYAAIFGAENPTVFKNALQDYLEDTLTNTSISTKYLVHETGATANERSLKNDYFIDHVFSNLLNAEKLEVLIFLGTTSSSNFKVDIIQNSIVVQSTTITVTSSTVWNAIQLNNRLSGNVEVNITGLSTHTGDRVPTFTANAFQTVDGAVINPSSAYRHQYQWLETVNSRKWVCDKFEPDLCWWQPYTYTITHTDWTTETIQEVPAIRFSNQDVMLWKYTVKDAINGHFPIKKEYFVNGILNSAVEKAYVDYPSYNTYKVINQGVQPDFSTPTGSLDQLIQEFMVDEGLSTESMDVDAYLANLMTVVGGSTDPALEASVMSQSVNFLNQLKRPYNSTHGESYLITYYYPGGPEPLRWGLFRQLDWYEQVCIKPVGDDCPLLEYKTVHMYDKVEKMGDLTLATDIGFPESLETIILAKSTDMVTYPISPYFFTWLAIKTQQIRGIAFTQIFMNDLVSSTPISPLLNVKADLANSYQAAVNLTDTHGYSAMGSVPVQIQDAFGTVKGEGTVYNGYGYISATNAQFAPGDKAVVTGSGFYLSSQAVGTIIQKPTTTSMSLVLDPEAATGVNPFVADITMKDSSDNMVMGNVPITIKDSNGNYVTSGTVQNGTARITLPFYKDTLQVTTGSSVFYGASSASGTAQYDLPGMIRTLGPAGSNAVDNAKFTIIKDYIETSGAFTYNSATDNYVWNGNDKFGSNTGCYKWTDDLPWPYPDVDRGYCVISSTPIAKSELDSSIFTSGSFVVRKYYGADFPVNQYTHDYTLSKMDFFTFWLGQKLEPTSWGGNPHEPSGYTQLNTLASDFSVFLSKDQSYFQNDPGAQSFSAKVRGLLDKATKIGFPTPAGVLEQLADFINSIINAFLSAIATVWNAIVSFVGAVANFLLAVWNNIVGPVLGAAIEVVKNVANCIIDTAVFLIADFLNSFSDSPTNPFNGMVESYADDSSLGSFFTGLSSHMNINSNISNFSQKFDSLSDSFGSLNSLVSILDITSFIPSEAGILFEITQLFSPSTIISLLYDTFDLFISKTIENSIQSSISDTFPSTLTFDTFEAKIDTIQSFDASSSMNPLGKVSSYNNDPNLPITQGKLATEDSSESSSNLLLNLYDSIFGSLRDFSEFIENIMNPITDIFYPLIDAISGAFYNFIIKFLIQGDFLIAQKVTLVAVLGYLSSLLGDKGDEIGGESGLDANKVRFNIPGINKSFKNGHLEMIFDVVALMLAAIQLDASNDVTNSLDALGKTDLANKLSYYSEFAWIIGFNNIGELAEDNGKMKSLKGIVDSTNQKANALEGFSEFIRIVANIDYLFHFSADVFQNTLGFGFKMSDGALFLGWMGFLANTGLNLILNLYGLYDNVVNFIPKTYSGKDQPNWMLNPSNRAELSSAMKKITIGITLVTLLGGLIGYAFASFNL